MTRKLKLIDKEILFPIIEILDSNDSATWTNIYNHTISEKGKRYASNDIIYSIDYYLEKKLIAEKQKDKQTRVYSLTINANNNYEDFLRNVTNKKKIKLEQLVEALDHKQIFTKDGGFYQNNHEDFTKFMIALEDSWQFYSTLLHTREDIDYDGDSMTGLADTQAHDIFNSKITYVIKLTKKSIDECCVKLKYGKDQDEITKINGMLENITWSMKSNTL